MLRHGHFPERIRDCLLVPIPKKGKDISLSESYRAIALASNVSKLFEWCLLLQFSEFFSTPDMQFDFKHGMSAFLYTGAIYQECCSQTHNYTDILLYMPAFWMLVRHLIWWTMAFCFKHHTTKGSRAMLPAYYPTGILFTETIS